MTMWLQIHCLLTLQGRRVRLIISLILYFASKLQATARVRLIFYVVQVPRGWSEFLIHVKSIYSLVRGLYMVCMHLLKISVADLNTSFLLVNPTSALNRESPNRVSEFTKRKVQKTKPRQLILPSFVFLKMDAYFLSIPSTKTGFFIFGVLLFIFWINNKFV